MKRFFTRACAKIARFFWSWGFLKFVVALIALVILFYVEEDWRGARELAAAKTRWQAAGSSLEPADYYPPPVPDDQNLAALPVFQLEHDPNDRTHPNWLMDLRLRDATDEDKHGGDLYDYEHKTDLAVLVGKAYAKMFPGKTPPASSLAQFEELYPFIVDVREAGATRPAFRLNQDYAFQPVWERPLGPITTQIKVANRLSDDTQLALRENQQQIAADDVKVGFEIARGVGTDPSLVGGLVALGVSAITRANVDDGLTKHAWNDAQLAQLQDELKQIDYLALCQFDMRSECAVYALPITETLKDNPPLMLKLIGNYDDESNEGPPIVALLACRIWASGWWDLNAAKMADLHLRLARLIDVKAHRIDADANRRLAVEAEKAKEMPGVLAPWNILYVISALPTINVPKKFAQGQAQVDEDRIVCGLERYRLAHGTYPPTLEALVPVCMDELPHDIMNGEPYHYRINAEGTFLLYSVGWNQVDDGGKVAYKSVNYTVKQIDYEQGDWVWPMFKR